METRNKEEARLKELNALLLSPEVLKNPKEYATISKEYKKIEQILQKYDERDKIRKEIQDTKELLSTSDEQMREVATHELDTLEKRLAALEAEIEDSSNPEYDAYHKDCIMEIRAGTGGDEASLFAADLLRMYTKYIERKGLKYEILSSHPSEIGGFKEIIVLISGENAYRVFRFEKGVHRVQRIPITETSGRIHTSTVTVAVLPEVEETQFEINPNDLKIDTFRASGHGGQHVNKVSSAVRITHLPSGTMVTCQDERSQYKNRVKAMKILRARLAAVEQEKQQRVIDKQRRQQVGTGERSEKIRTYNFPQSRVTDHRIGLSLYNLDTIMEGDLDTILEGLENYERTRKRDK